MDLIRQPVPPLALRRAQGLCSGQRGPCAAAGPDAGELVSSRRGFLSRLVAALVALGAAAVGVPVVGALGAPALPVRRPESWIDFGAIDGVPVGRPRKLVAEFQDQDAWYRHRVRRAVWVVRRSTDALTVFSARCTHLGCAYRWDDQRGQFACPCHGGTFAITGAVTGGPPPRPLIALDVKVEAGRLRVRLGPGEAA